MSERPAENLRGAGLPHWMQDVDATLPVTSQYVLHSNIRDRHLVDSPGQDSPALLDTVSALWQLLQRSGYQFLLHHSPVHGLRAWGHDEDAVNAAREVLNAIDVSLGRETTYQQLATVVGALTPPTDASAPTRVRWALAVDYVSNVLHPGEPPQQELHDLMIASLDRVHGGSGLFVDGTRNAALYNPVFWLVEKPSDLPAWMVSGSDGIRQVPIPLPDLDTRLHCARLLAPTLGVDNPAGFVERFAEATEGMTLRGMMEVTTLALDNGGAGVDDIDDSVQAYRLGLTDNPWKKPELQERIVAGVDRLSGRVKGQPRAVRHAVDILIRSTLGMTAAHKSGGTSGPRGVMFFAGPTGVGKTELAKAITELVFGDERAYIRFDMSEFSAEQSEARLIGSPPGFVGHGSGGELTNAVRQRPFSLILFDEIEKGHPRILDKFLQVLSDGRLTDGSGDTVHFSETIVVFTSNLGVRGIDGDSLAPADFEERVRQGVEREFREHLNRPELLGRIGRDNIVVFDKLSTEVATQLVDGFVRNVTTRVAQENGIRLVLAEAARDRLLAACVGDLSLGGRGVGDTVETKLVNPLARELVGVGPGSTLTIVDLHERDGAPAIESEVS